MNEEELVRVGLEGDEWYPVLTITDYLADTDVPRALLDAIRAADVAREDADEALLNWLHERQPKHPIFYKFPHQEPAP